MFRGLVLVSIAAVEEKLLETILFSLCFHSYKIAIWIAFIQNQLFVILKYICMTGQSRV